MQLHKNKVIVSSVVYCSSLIVIATIFGMWHNVQLKNASGNYLYFIILVILIVSFLSWFYFTTFKEYRKEISEKVGMEQSEGCELNTAEIINSEEKVKENFDKDAFILGILPVNKKLINEYGDALLKNLADKLQIVQGLFFIKPKGEDTFEAIAKYAYYTDETPPSFKVGESLPGQAIKDNRIVFIQNVPESYVPIISGLGRSKPKSLMMVPVFADNEPVGLIEISLFTAVDSGLEPALKELSDIVGKNIIKLMN